MNHKVVSIDKAAKTVSVQNVKTGESFIETYDFLVLATGARPRKPQIEGIERALVLRDVADADALKLAISKSQTKTAVILGGGFIGIETAENLVHAGFSVHLVQRGKQLLGTLEPEIVEVFQQHLETNGVVLHLNSEAVKISENTVTLADGTELEASIVVSAAGIMPDNQLARDAALKFGQTGGLWVDKQQRTSDEYIFAAGDAVEKHGLLTGEETLIPLANIANRHGRLIADVISGLDVRAHASLGTAIIGAFGMAIASTGLGPKQATVQGISHHTIHIHPGSHAGYYPGAKRISMLVVFETTTGKLLGAQAVGEDGADKRIDVIATAIHGGLTVNDLMDLELSYSPQYGSAKDPINHAGYVGNNVITGRTPTFQWHELEAELAKPNTILVDVRTPGENQAGTTPKSININVDDLRENLKQLQGKRVLVHCQVGQRGHTATQILLGHGIEALNLDGGYLTWRAGQDSQERR